MGHCDGLEFVGGGVETVVGCEQAVEWLGDYLGQPVAPRPPLAPHTLPLTPSSPTPRLPLHDNHSTQAHLRTLPNPNPRQPPLPLFLPLPLPPQAQPQPHHNPDHPRAHTLNPGQRVKPVPVHLGLAGQGVQKAGDGQRVFGEGQGERSGLEAIDYGRFEGPGGGVWHGQ